VTVGGIGFSAVIPNLDPGDYSVTELVPEGWTLTSSSCRGANNRLITNTSDIELEQGENVVCTFTNKKKNDDKAEDVTKLFVNRRVDNLLTYGPDRARLLRRLDQQQQQESLKDGPSDGGYEPLKITGSIGEESKGQMSFSTSLSQLRSAAAAAANGKLTDPSLSFHDSYSGYTPLGLTQRLDLWVEGQLTTYDDTLGGIRRDGDFKFLYVGMDYAISPGFLIGALVQIDRTDESIKDADLKGNIEGTGWMAGPYVGIKLRDNLFFDARAAWGRSTNDIALDDAVVDKRTGSFDTDRWLATATLTGNYQFGALRFSPQIGIAYGNETSDAYKTSLGQDVGAADVTIGRLTFGPEFAYTRRLQDGTLVEPHVSIKGIWNFDQETLDLSTGPVTPEEFRAQIEAGILIKTPDGYSVRAAGSYDGIGDKDLEAWSAKAWLNIPLN
jgi:outer membrane autotransporter protein